MKLVILFATIYLVFSYTAAIACDWGRVQSDINWSMDTKNINDMGAQGHNEMVDAVRRGNANFMGQFKNGFHGTQTNTGNTQNFDNCAAENQNRVYNMGRAALGLPPV